MGVFMRAFPILVLLMIGTIASVSLGQKSKPRERRAILFLDLNNNPKEVESVRRAARARNEDVIVLPDPDASVRSEIMAASRKVGEASKRLARCHATTGAECGKIYDAYSKANVAKSLATAKVGFNQTKLAEELGKLKAAGVSLSSVILSGHDGNGDFTGVFGDLDDEELDKAFKANEPLGDSVQSMVLLGCFSTNLGNLETHWKNIFPNDRVVMGYDERAPLGGVKAGHDYLEGYLIKEKQLMQAKDSEQMADVFKSINNINLVRASICVDNDTIITNTGVRSVGDMLKMCDEPFDQKMTKDFKCFMRAKDPKCQEVPKTKVNNPIDAYYKAIQEKAHCRSLPGFAQNADHSPDTVIRLIHDYDVRQNFARLYKKELNELTDLMKVEGLLKGVDPKTGKEVDLRLDQFDRLSRGEFLARKRLLKKLVNERYDSFKEAALRDGDIRSRVDNANVLALKEMIDALDVVGSHDGDCVPMAWLEPGSHVRSNCTMVSKMENALETAQYRAMNIRMERMDEGRVIAALDVNRGRKELAKLTAETKKIAEEAFSIHVDQRGDVDNVDKLLNLRERLIKNKRQINLVGAKAEFQVAAERVSYYQSAIAAVEKGGSPDGMQCSGNCRKSLADRLEFWQRIAESKKADVSRVWITNEQLGLNDITIPEILKDAVNVVPKGASGLKSPASQNSSSSQNPFGNSSNFLNNQNSP